MVASGSPRSRGPRRGLLIAAAVLVVVAIGAALAIVATRPADDHDRVATAPDPEVPAPVGVLVPTAMATLAGDTGELEATGTFDGDAFRLDANRGDHTLTWVSQPGTQLGENGLPLRCTGARADAGGRTAREATKVSGPSAHLTMLSSGSLLAMTAVSPDLYKVNRDGLPGLPATELGGSVLLTPEQAVRLAGQPDDTTEIIHSWSHAFDGELEVKAELGGSLGRGVFYRVFLRADGREVAMSTDTFGLQCNQAEAWINTSDASYFLILLNGGTSLRVDGEAVTDMQHDPTVQGNWAVATVSRASGEAEVEIVGARGETVRQWTETYRPPESE